MMITPVIWFPGGKEGILVGACVLCYDINPIQSGLPGQRVEFVMGEMLWLCGHGA